MHTPEKHPSCHDFETDEALGGDILSAVSAALGPKAFSKHLAQLAFSRYDAGCVYFILPTQFLAFHAEKNYAEALLEAARIFLPQARRLCIEVRNSLQTKEAPPFSPRPAFRSFDAGRPYDDLKSFLRPDLTFENFIEDPSNQYAHQCALQAAQGAGDLKKLFLHAPVGLGKTHLLEAIAHYIGARRVDQKALYLSAEMFTTRFIQSFQQKTTEAFKAALLAYDILLMDDIHFIAGKRATQEALLTILNRFSAEDKTVVLAATQSPSHIANMPPSLVSRFNHGVVAAIQPTSYALRYEIVRAKNRQARNFLGQDVLEFLARTVTSNIRELEGAFLRLKTKAELTGSFVSLDFATHTLQDLIRTTPPAVSADDIIRETCRHFGLLRGDLLSQRRSRSVARPRQLAILLAKQLTPLSLSAIGEAFGGRDHTTVLHAVHKMEALLQTEDGLAHSARQIRLSLQQPLPPI